MEHKTASARGSGPKGRDVALDHRGQVNHADVCHESVQTGLSALRSSYNVIRAVDRGIRRGGPRWLQTSGIEEAAPRQGAGSSLQEQAKRHLWMHFTRMGAYADHEVPDDRARRGLLRLGRARQALPGRPLRAVLRERRPRPRRSWPRRPRARRKELGFYVNWSYAHPPAIELAARVAALAPGDLNRVFFTSGGSEAVESAWKLARNYHRVSGEGKRTKLIARELAYHGTSLGALAATGLTALRAPVRAAHAGRLPRAEHEQLSLARTTATRCGPPTRSRSGSCSKGPRRSPR